MSMTLRIIIDALLVVGAFFALAGTVGIIRMPDCFCRMQSSTNIATLGLFMAIIGGALYTIFVMHSWASFAKILFIGLIYIIQNPAGGQAMARSAYRRGNEHVELVCDDLLLGESQADIHAAQVKEGGDK